MPRGRKPIKTGKDEKVAEKPIRKRKEAPVPEMSTVFKKMRKEADQVLQDITDGEDVDWKTLSRVEKILRTEIEQNFKPTAPAGFTGSEDRDRVIDAMIRGLGNAANSDISFGDLAVCKLLLTKQSKNDDTAAEELNKAALDVLKALQNTMQSKVAASPITIFPERPEEKCVKCDALAIWRSEYCEAHNRERGLCVMKSRIPSGGQGLFAIKTFDDFILEYTGPKVKQPYPQSHTLFEFKKGEAINGNGMATFVNTGRLPTELSTRYDREGKPERKEDGSLFKIQDILVAKKDHKRLIANAKLCVSRRTEPPTVYLKAIKPIKGTPEKPVEIIVPYGRGFSIHTERIYVCDKHDAEFAICRGEFCEYDSDNDEDDSERTESDTD